MFGFSKKKGKPSHEEEPEAQPDDPIQDVIKEMGDKGVRQYCLDYLELKESDLERLRERSDKTTSIVEDLSDLMPHINEAFRKNSDVMRKLNRTSEAEIRRSIRSITSSNTQMEQRDSIRRLLVLVGGLLKKRFN